MDSSGHSRSQSDQQHSGHDTAMHSERSANGHSGEGAASALAHMIAQERKSRKQDLQGDDATERSQS